MATGLPGCCTTPFRTPSHLLRLAEAKATWPFEQVVGRGEEVGHELVLFDSSVAGLAEACNGFEPAETLLDELAPALAGQEALMPQGSLVQAFHVTSGYGHCMGFGVQTAQPLHKGGVVGSPCSTRSWLT